MRYLIHSFSLALALVLLGARPACGHDPFEITTQVQMRADSIDLLVTMSRATALRLAGRSTVFGELFDPAKFQDLKPTLLDNASQLYELRAGGTLIPPRQLDVQLDRENDVQFRLIYPRPEGSTLRMDALHIRRLPPEGYGAAITVSSDTGKMIGLKLLVAEDSSIETPLGPPSATVAAAGTAAPTPATDPAPPAITKPSFRAFLTLGVEHILTGYDHLLFLLALLVVCHRVKPMLAIITSFTLAHSLTLALAALDLVQVSGKIVEPLIAASIVFVGVENLVRGEVAKGRARVAFGFGLIHGLGFAGVLREIGLGTGGSPIALPLFSFNLGVEIGQICVAAVVLPLLWLIRKIHFVHPYVNPAISVAVTLAGGFWLVERLWP